MNRRLISAVIAGTGLITAGCGGASSSDGTVGEALAGDTLVRNISAVVGVALEGGARDRSQEVRLTVANLDTVRGTLSVRILTPEGGETDSSAYLVCSDPRLVGAARAGSASTEIVCTMPPGAETITGATGGSTACKPEVFQVCGDNGCGPRIEEQWYYYTPHPEAP